MQQDVDNAEASFNHALSLDRNFGESYGGLAIIEALKGNWAKAEEYSKIAKKLDGEAMSTYYVTILKLQSEGRANDANRLTSIIMKSNKLPNGATFQDLLNKVSNKHVKK